MPGSGETSPKPVFRAMPTQPDHTSAAAGAARTSSGQDRTVRPGWAAVRDRSAVAGPTVRAGRRPRRPGSAAGDASTVTTAIPVTTLRSWRAGGAHRSARPARRPLQRGWRARRWTWRRPRCRRQCARRRRGRRRTRSSARPTSRWCGFSPHSPCSVVPLLQLACAAGRLTRFASSATSGSEEEVVEQRRPQVRLPADGGYRHTETKQKECAESSAC